MAYSDPFLNLFFIVKDFRDKNEEALFIKICLITFSLLQNRRHNLAHVFKFRFLYYDDFKLLIYIIISYYDILL